MFEAWYDWQASNQFWTCNLQLIIIIDWVELTRHHYWWVNKTTGQYMTFNIIFNHCFKRWDVAFSKCNARQFWFVRDYSEKVKTEIRVVKMTEWSMIMGCLVFDGIGIYWILLIVSMEKVRQKSPNEHPSLTGNHKRVNRQRKADYHWAIWYDFICVRLS